MHAQIDADRRTHTQSFTPVNLTFSHLIHIHPQTQLHTPTTFIFFFSISPHSLRNTHKPTQEWGVGKISDDSLQHCWLSILSETLTALTATLTQRNVNMNWVQSTLLFTGCCFHRFYIHALPLNMAECFLLLSVKCPGWGRSSFDTHRTDAAWLVCFVSCLLDNTNPS